MKRRPKRLRSGVCKFCSCTNARGCVLGYQAVSLSDGMCIPKALMCSWFDVQRTVCTKASCVEAYMAKTHTGANWQAEGGKQ